MEEEEEEEEFQITSVDIGYLHLAFVHAVIIIVHGMIWKVKEIIKWRMLNISHFNCNRATCQLRHDKCVTDYLMHLVLEEPCFNQSKTILVERQPITGLQAVQEFFIHEFRDKVILIHPRSLHCYFHMNHFKGTKEEKRIQRKLYTERQASIYLERFKQDLNKIERKHDVADAIVQLWYYVITENKKRNPTKSKYFLS
jgi:hypothetical protein